ncbi:MAG: DUF362 domain-containing protein [Proteobacteria bacterium]|nr:DUF362 domain-containing protein [Pseudomonadota bacterium]
MGKGFPHKFTRRQFIKKAGTAAGGLWLSSHLPTLLSGCGGGGQEAVQAKSIVAAVRKTTVADSVRRAVELSGGLDFIQPGQTVLLKPNLNSPDPFPATTNPEVVSAMIGLVKEKDPGRVILSDRSWYIDPTTKILNVTGIGDVARDAGAEVIPFDDGEWVQVNPAGAENWTQGFSIPALIQQVDHVISMPVAKTHRIAYFTMALKNWVGITSPADRQFKLHLLALEPKFGSMIAEIHLAVRADLYVMDATKVFVTEGPHEGDVRDPGLIIASRDPVACDVFGLSLLKYLGTEARIQDVSVWNQVMIRRAIELGLGASGPEGIELLADGIPELDAIRVILKT